MRREDMNTSGGAEGGQYPMDDRIKEIAEYYGTDTQLMKLAEECGELVRAVAREATYPSEETRGNLIEELADTLVMIQQIAYLYDAVDEVETVMHGKLDRQLDRMEEEDAAHQRWITQFREGDNG